MKEELSKKIKDKANNMAVGAFVCGLFWAAAPILPYTWLKISTFGASIIFGVSTFYFKRKLAEILKNQ